MSTARCLSGIFVGAAVTVSGGLVAASAAASGAAGAAVLNLAGHVGYVASEAAKVGALGGGIVGSALSIAATVAMYRGFFGDPRVLAVRGFDKGDPVKNKKCETNAIFPYVGGVVACGLTGYGFMNSTGATIMNLARTAASFAVGGAITAIPTSCLLYAIAMPLTIAAGGAILHAVRPDPEGLEIQFVPS